MADNGEFSLDYRGYRCPVPALKLQAAIRNATPDASFRVKTDDPVAKIDVPHAARELGWEARLLAENGDSCDFLVTRDTEK